MFSVILNLSRIGAGLFQDLILISYVIRLLWVLKQARLPVDRFMMTLIRYSLPQEENCGNRLSFFICYIFRFAFE